MHAAAAAGRGMQPGQAASSQHAGSNEGPRGPAAPPGCSSRATHQQPSRRCRRASSKLQQLGCVNARVLGEDFEGQRNLYTVRRNEHAAQRSRDRFCPRGGLPQGQGQGVQEVHQPEGAAAGCQQGGPLLAPNRSACVCVCVCNSGVPHIIFQSLPTSVSSSINGLLGAMDHGNACMQTQIPNMLPLLLLPRPAPNVSELSTTIANTGPQGGWMAARLHFLLAPTLPPSNLTHPRLHMMLPSVLLPTFCRRAPP